ncbi:hypothetical protein GW17_00050583 [Ensete ventricosum]|nr:hypothetical protein GW17_00050583 [Ensete ventricosum]
MIEPAKSEGTNFSVAAEQSFHFLLEGDGLFLTLIVELQVKSIHRVDAVGNSLGVRRELAEGIGSLLGWHKGVHQKKIETRRKIVRGSRKTCLDGISSKFAKRFAERIKKLVGNTLGDRPKTHRKNAGGCRIGGS